jgi:pyruvate dehydrogenase (quinone)
MHPQYVAKTVDELAVVFSCDVGTPTVWAARYLTMNGKRRLLGSFSHGSMANALPQAIGAQVAFPNHQVVTYSGDGGLAMLLGDLLSLRQHKLSVKIIVFSNSSLSFVELEMMAAGILGKGTELINPDFVALAQSAGVLAVRVEDPADLNEAVTIAFEQAVQRSWRRWSTEPSFPCPDNQARPGGRFICGSQSSAQCAVTR